MKEFKKVRQDKKREIEEFDYDEFLMEKDILMGAYWGSDVEPSPEEIEKACEEARRSA